MIEKLLAGLRVLIVEDEFLIAMVLESAIDDAGAELIQMASCVEDALVLIKGTPFDVAVLDARLDDEPVTAVAVAVAVADALDAIAVPFIFHSGYGRENLPERHRHRTLLRKPSFSKDVVLALCKEMG